MSTALIRYRILFHRLKQCLPEEADETAELRAEILDTWWSLEDGEIAQLAPDEVLDDMPPD